MIFTTTNKPYLTILLSWTCSAFLLCRYSCEGNMSYEDVTRVMEDRLGSKSRYNDAVRPLKNQSNVLEVNVTFDLVSILELDALQQKFSVNGFLGMSWKDEIVRWKDSDYGNVYYIHPYPKQIWRPRLILANTLGERDLFEDDYSPLFAYSSGFVHWTPGGLYPTSCNLNLTKFPFDKQLCVIKMYSMSYSGEEIRFTPIHDLVDLAAYDESGEWNIERAIIRTGASGLSYFEICFELRRLPGFFIINTIAPIFLMSFLNILVFVIPVDSGEKISYGITVLLALTVFMSIVSDQLPRTSKTLPLVTVYLLALAVMSWCTVVATIFIVYCRHREQQKEKSQRRAMSYIKSLFHKINPLSKASTAIKNGNSSHQNYDVNNSESPSTMLHSLDVKIDMVDVGSQENQSSADVEDDNKIYINRWKKIGKHLDFVFFIFFTFVWLSLTIIFMVVIAVD